MWGLNDNSCIMKPMTQHNIPIQSLRDRVSQAAALPAFVHQDWYVRFHLKIVETIALELCDVYSEANRQKVHELVWLHDVEKIADVRKKDDTALTATRAVMAELGYPTDYIDELSADINTINAKQDIGSESIEVQIISSADGAAHLVGPFYGIYWHENPSMSIQDILSSNRVKLAKDWSKKITLPEVRKAFERRYAMQVELNTGEIPTSFLSEAETS